MNRIVVATCLAGLCILGLGHPLPAVILYGLDNTANTTDPGNGLPWNDVGAVLNGSGTLGSGSASCINLGDGWMLTANHVFLSSQVSLGGVNYTIDNSYTPQQVDGADLKIFKVTNTSLTSNIVLNTSATADLGNDAVIVGFGLGKGTAITNGFNWGDDTTRDQRWGTNDTLNATFSVDTGAGISTAIATSFNNNVTPPADQPAEATATNGDSGGALFIQVSGEWRLAGVTLAVQQQAGANTSTYGNTASADRTYYARVATYADSIIAIIPEPSTGSLLALGGIAALLRRRRQ